MKNLWAGILWATANVAAVVPAWADAAQPVSPAPVAAPTVTTDDYARAERFLPYNTTPLVLHSPGPATWLPNGTAWYSIKTAQGTTPVLVDPARRKREEGSPKAKQAAAPTAPVDPNTALKP